MGKKLTINDVARLAGVSKATASRVLNGNPQVDAQLRERVLKVVKEVDFVPSINALGLNGRSQLLGILLPRYLWSALQEITWSIADYVNKQTRYEIIFYSSSHEDGYARVIDQIIQTNLVAGLIATLHDQSPSHLVELHRQGLPILLVDTIGLQTELPTITTENYHGAYQAVRYLLDLGHRRIGYIHGFDGWQCSRVRHQAYCDALKDAGLQADPALFYPGDFGPDSGKEGAQVLLAQPERPTAIFACNDDMAYGAMLTAQQQGLRIPHDLSIVGFNDDPSAFIRSTFTTVHQPFGQMARYAAEILVALLSHQPHVFSEEWQEIHATTLQATPVQTLADLPMPCRIEFPTHLVIRNSSAPPPA